ncbi:MAG TPA: c-type cytochrome [Bryobacteraceae bacterium]|nr:c-type cytochrome [Bryobacteraceae bacterium]
MKRIAAPLYLFLLVAVGVSTFAVHAQDKSVKKVPAKPTAAMSGKDLFRQYCAVCHGQDAKGSGPAAGALKTNPTDLTQISRRNNGKFPEQKILATFRGESGVPAHGSAEMPIWGPIFTNMTPNLHEGQDRVYALLNYMEEIQAK